jgi:hypothetical protein
VFIPFHDSRVALKRLKKERTIARLHGEPYEGITREIEQLERER